jgi:hypothetical protein
VLVPFFGFVNKQQKDFNQEEKKRGTYILQKKKKRKKENIIFKYMDVDCRERIKQERLSHKQARE